jgi:hypothetical protein
METKVKKLSLNKETLLRLQEKQMNALAGGEAALVSGGSTMGSGCPNYTDNVGCPGEVTLQSIPNEVQAAQAVSCCKKTCNN